MAKSVLVAVRKGHVAGLEAMRDKLAEAMDNADPAVVAQISGRLQAVLDRLAELGSGEEVSRLDELAKRRSDRFADPEPAAPARKPARERAR